MNYWDKKLIREQLDKKLTHLKVLASYEISQAGWIRTLRDALDMSSAQLGKKISVSQARVSQMEQSELDGNIKIVTMQKVAEALDMEFVYGFVPRISLEEMVRTQARKIATQRMKRVNHTMALEDQELNNDEKAQAMEDLIAQILIERPKDFWNQ